MNCTPLTDLDDLSSVGLLSQAKQIALLIKSWKKARTFLLKVPQSDNLVVDVHRKNSLNNDFWVARVTEFQEISVQSRKKVFDLLMRYVVGSTSDLSQSHTEYEVGYIHELVDCKLTPYKFKDTAEDDDYDSITYLAEVDYQLQFPLKKRKFCNLVHIAKCKDANSAYVISLAVDPSVIGCKVESSFVQGSYTSVELVAWDPQTESLLWEMATCSNAGGNLPQWLAKLKLNGIIAKDVSSFLKKNR